MKMKKKDKTMEEDLLLYCPLCELEIQVSKNAIGDTIRCPECKQEVEEQIS